MLCLRHALSPSFLDEIRQRLPVSEVVGRRVKLKKQGREWRGLSPFNAEKTPSFYVNDQKGFYHCFSSGKHGDQFRFLMETEGLSFPEAVERLAADAGLAMPKVSAEEVQRAEKARTLYDVLELAATYFQAMLQDRVGAKARGYLAGRDLGAPTQLKFRLGYAPGERFGLKEHLGSKGVSVPDMIAAGLLVHGDDIPVPYDRFRDRVMFPITDLRGRVVAFGGRALEKDVPAKYLNSPETDLFHKGSLLYNAHGAREVAHRSNRIIAVEGYVDVIAMVMAGFGETVAPLGTALTEGQLDLLWKMAPEPVLLFDGDKAGRRAAYRAIDIALPLLKPGRSLLFAALPEGQDPTTSSAPRGVRRWMRCWPRPSRSPPCCGSGRPRRASSARRKSARRWKHGLPRSWRRSVTRTCAGIIATMSSAGCRTCSGRCSGRGVRAGRGRGAPVRGEAASAAAVSPPMACRTTGLRRGSRQARWCAGPAPRSPCARR